MGNNINRKVPGTTPPYTTSDDEQLIRLPLVLRWDNGYKFSLSFRHGCATSEEIFWKLRSIQTFIQELHWPDEIFAEHMMNRLKLMAADMTAACLDR